MQFVLSAADKPLVDKFISSKSNLQPWSLINSFTRRSLMCKLSYPAFGYLCMFSFSNTCFHSFLESACNNNKQTRLFNLITVKYLSFFTLM